MKSIDLLRLRLLAPGLSLLLHAVASAQAPLGTVIGGSSNRANGPKSVIIGGAANTATARIATIITGAANTVTGQGAGIITGYQNSNAGFDSVIVSGARGEIVSGASRSTILAGLDNTIAATASQAFIGAGSGNTVSGARSGILCGNSHTLAGSDSAILSGASKQDRCRSRPVGGRGRGGDHQPRRACFVWNAGEGALATTANGQFLIGVTNGVGVNVQDPRAPLHVTGGNRISRRGGGEFIAGEFPSRIAIDGDDIQRHEGNRPGDLYLNRYGGDVVVGSPGFALVVATDLIIGSTFSVNSDRNLKDDFREVDNEEILDRLTDLPLSTWKFKASQSRRHIGPMAQDFHAAFDGLLDLRSDDTTIAPIDEIGVALGAIQALGAKSEEKDRRIAELETETLELRRRLEALEQLLVQDPDETSGPEAN